MQAVRYRQTEENQLDPRLTGLLSLNPCLEAMSSSRNQMMGSHIGQRLVIAGATERRLQTGVEAKLGKFTLKVEAPVQMAIIQTFDRYPKTFGDNSFELSPEKSILYEDVFTKEVGLLSIPKYNSLHQYFGYEYKTTEAYSSARKGLEFKKGAIFADSPAIGENGSFNYGIELNVAYMTLPATSEDGIIVCRSILDQLAIKTYEQRSETWESNKFPINLYGDEKNYKICPDVGEKVRDDGLVMMLRDCDDELVITEQSINSVRKPNYMFDRGCYAAGKGGRIVDIKVIASGKLSEDSDMDRQMNRYYIAGKQHSEAIFNEYRRLRRDRGEYLMITPELQQAITRHYGLYARPASARNSGANSIKMVYKRNAFNGYRADFTIEYNIIPDLGFKLTDLCGGKGVITEIREPHEMPVDSHGNRAQIICDPNGTISRMNVARSYEQFFNAASRDTTKTVRKMLNMTGLEPNVARYVKEHLANNSQLLEDIWQYIVGYYQLISLEMYSLITSPNFKGTKLEHITEVAKKGIYIFKPANSQKELVATVQDIRKSIYEPNYSVVSWYEKDGSFHTSKNKIRVGSIYMILLEKIADDGAAVASGKFQHLGVLAQVTPHDKFTTPYKVSSTRVGGEAEFRILNSFTPEGTSAELIDRNNCQHTNRLMCDSILQADNPSRIAVAVDRTKHPVGGSNPLQNVKHILMCMGIRFKYATDRINSLRTKSHILNSVVNLTERATESVKGFFK